MLVRSTDAESGIAFNDSGSANTFGTRLGSKADDLTFTTNGSERMRIDSAGNVGIGNQDPKNKLHVTGVAGTSPGVAISEELGRVWQLSAVDTTEFRIGHGGTPASMTEYMRIDSSGNVGIGEASPNVKLVVDGSTRVTTSFIAPSADSAAAPAYTWNGDTDTGMFRRSDDSMGFSTGGVQRMYISSGGVARVVTDGNDDRIAGTASGASAATIERFITCSQAEYNALTPDANTLYIIV